MWEPGARRVSGESDLAWFRLSLLCPTMKVFFIGGSDEVAGTISLILRVRWPELSVTHTANAREGLELIHREQPDIVMLESGEDPASCCDLIGQIRGFSDVPLVVLSRRNDVVDKVRALEMGADDWLKLSSVPMEFIAKVNALLRRCYPRRNDHPSASFLSGRLSIDYRVHEVTVSGMPVKLTPIEYKILCQLARNEGSIVSCGDLLLTVWGPTYDADREFIKKYIHRLRSKIEEDPANPKAIRNARGVGYVLGYPGAATV